MIGQPYGECDGGYCDRRAVSWAYDTGIDALIPVCRRHILVYRIKVGRLWQAEDEWLGVRFCRRSRFRWLAQRRLLRDQRAALAGRESRYQARRRRRADR